jgi:rhodanese-related sulfurtransferase
MFDQTQIRDPQKAREYFENKMAFTTGPAELESMIKNKKNINIIDVRAAKDYGEAHIPGAHSLPQDQWASLLGLQKNMVNVIYCYSHVCHLAAKAAVEFAAKGFPVMELDGGFKAWKEHNLQVETGPGAQAAS